MNRNTMLELIATFECAAGMSKEVPGMKGFLQFYKDGLNPEGAKIIAAYEKARVKTLKQLLSYAKGKTAFKNTCPHCGCSTDRTTPLVSPEAPKEGDMSICCECGAIGVFTTDLALRLPTPDEMAHLRASPEWPRVQAAQEQVRQHKAKGSDQQSHSE